MTKSMHLFIIPCSSSHSFLIFYLVKLFISFNLPIFFTLYIWPLMIHKYCTNGTT